VATEGVKVKYVRE
jgi:splicing factor 3B subunit 1